MNAMWREYDKTKEPARFFFFLSFMLVCIILLPSLLHDVLKLPTVIATNGEPIKGAWGYLLAAVATQWRIYYLFTK